MEQAGFKSFNTVSRTIQNHYETILNFFENRSTIASAESFNAKIKAFRTQFRRVPNVEFFLFSLSKIYGYNTKSPDIRTDPSHLSLLMGNFSSSLLVTIFYFISHQWF
ncbi:hypothetical protein EL17_18490 [Anditalea andensis]|uniref:Transposase IS204/IS1001/IS1096/IS1165 DDE domain-containing protein n=1 Tax=Anditalea andensis TaxID=1048983 RepID=A0A074KRY8_9BACT|nr:hypothetical protein EL17_18490 [Anditalea andensis]